MQHLLRHTLIITLFTLLGQVVIFLTQVVLAALFGARPEMDAFLAASTLPQYVIAVLTSALSFVFIPVFVDYTTAGQADQAWQVASGMINLSLLVLGAITIAGVLFAEPLLRLTTPGLTPGMLRLAARMAMITWPAILAAGLLSLLTGIYQAQQRFSWSAAVPFIGALANLGILLVLAPLLGVVGLAIATTGSFVLQALLLAHIGFGAKRYRFALHWSHPGMQQALRLLLPLILSGLLLRWTPVIDRYLASNLGAGAISHLGYATRLLGTLGLLISTGITTVAFPRMALNMGANDIAGLRSTMSIGLRMMWLVVAPVIVIGEVLTLPLITAVFQRGEFSAGDAAAVAGLLGVYLLALVSMCLGGITARTFYALKDTRTPALVGVVEALAYVGYTALLARWFGAPGVALGFVIYYNFSLIWQTVVLRYKIGNTGGRTVIRSFARTGAAALLGGLAAWGAVALVSNVWLQLVISGGAGVAVYVAVLWGLGSVELRMIWAIVADRMRQSRSPQGVGTTPDKVTR